MISDLLKTDIDRYAHRLRQSSPLLLRAKAGELVPAMVGCYFAGISYLISHTEAHLTLARSRAAESGFAELAAFFDHKLAEEHGHEKWAEADLAGLDRFFGATVKREPPPGVVRLVDTIESAIRENPHFYLAYVLFSEYMTVSLGPEWVDALDACCGVPRSAMTVATHHIELDKGHVAEGLAEIDALAGDPALHEPLRAMLADSMRDFSAFCDDVCNLAA